MTDIDDAYVAPKTPFDYISHAQLQDMWGAGFTVIRRNTFGSDIYEAADKVKRPGMARQWVDIAEVDQFLANGWRQIFNETYPGLFAPFGYVGPVEINKLFLFECPQHKVDKAKEAQVAAAHKLVTDWQDKYGGKFSGTVTVGTQTKLGELDRVETMEVGSKTIEDTTKIPRDMGPYIDRIFEERDRLADDYVKGDGKETAWASASFEAHMMENPDAPKWPTLNAILLPQAIQNVRKRITEEANSGQAH